MTHLPPPHGSLWSVSRSSRTTDPPTSKENSSAELNAVAKEWVLGVMGDGVERLDEEIAEACKRDGCELTPDRTRHGRLACSIEGAIVDTGKRKPTKNGGTGRVWRIQ